jgi:hypothetical protein
MKLTDIKNYISKRLGTGEAHPLLWTERNQADYENTRYEFDRILVEARALTGERK